MDFILLRNKKMIFIKCHNMLQLITKYTKNCEKSLLYEKDVHIFLNNIFIISFYSATVLS